MMSRLTICIIIFGVLSSLITGDDPCRFEDSSNGVIDLSTVGHTDGTAAFPDEVPPSGSYYKYSYNPCKPFNEGTECNNVAACQVSIDGKLRFPLGTQDSVKWNPGAGAGTDPTVKYSLGPKVVMVTLHCSESTTGEFTAFGEPTQNNYLFTLAHKCACRNGCKNGPGPGPGPGTTPKTPTAGSGVAGGTIFIAIIAIPAVVYFIAFAIYYRFRQQRSGKDLIAHRTFWVGLPIYARDGVVYVFRRATGKGGLAYQSV